MSIDRIYREFFGFSLIIFSLFLFGSLITFSYLDTTEDLLIVDKEFKNNFGFLGALFSTNLFFNFGLVSFYLVFILFYFGLLFFFNYSEKDSYLYVLDNINKFLLGLFSVLLACNIHVSTFLENCIMPENYMHQPVLVYGTFLMNLNTLLPDAVPGKNTIDNICTYHGTSYLTERINGMSKKNCKQSFIRWQTVTTSQAFFSLNK